MPATNEYTIIIDRLAIIDATDASDDAICAAFRELAANADATFTNVRVVPATDTHAFSPDDVTLAFDATLADVARYARTYDVDYDAIIAV